MPHGKCSFKQQWLQKREYSAWLKQDEKKENARCSVCVKTFDISNMGESTLRRHQDGSKHKANMKAKADASLSSMDDFRVNNSSVREDQTNETTTASERNPAAGTIQSLVTRKDCLSAEILWTLKVVTSHYSFSSCSDVQQLFERMFPDSNVAEQFTCGETKCAYLCNFGIAPHFKQLLKNTVSDQDTFVLLFDESLNKKTHNKQMDIHCRIWEIPENGAPPQVQMFIYFGSIIKIYDYQFAPVRGGSVCVCGGGGSRGVISLRCLEAFGTELLAF